MSYQEQVEYLLYLKENGSKDYDEELYKYYNNMLKGGELEEELEEEL